MRRTITLFALLVLVAACSAQVNTIADVINNNPSFSTLSKLLTAANLQYTLSQPDSYTLFAPNNTAFKALPSYVISTLLKPENSNLLQSVLLYHVLPGVFSTFEIIQLDNRTLVSAQGSTIALDIRSSQKVFLQGVISLNDARVIQSNIPASNGVIHSLDRVLIADLWQFVSPYPNIFGLISQNTALSTLAYALKATGLDQVLTQSKGTYTVFAPTNDAFEDPLLAPLFGVNNRDALKQVLLYHVLGMPVYSTQLYDGLVAPTAQGATVAVRRTNFLNLSTTTVNDALILTTDTTAFNGVIHTIDRVLLPFTF